MKFSVCGEVVFKSVLGIVTKIVSLSNYRLTESGLSGRAAWIDYTCVEF